MTILRNAAHLLQCVHNYMKGHWHVKFSPLHKCCLYGATQWRNSRVPASERQSGFDPDCDCCLYGVCIFSLLPRGHYPGPQVSYHSPKGYRFIVYLVG